MDLVSENKASYKERYWGTEMKKQQAKIKWGKLGSSLAGNKLKTEYING